MRAALALVLALVACAAGGRSPAQAEELWQQLPPPAAMPKAEESGYAQVNDIQMYYAVFGKGEPLLLLHGGLGNSDYWGNQVPAFAEHYRVIVADSRGHGRSTRSGQPYSYQLMASDVLALMDHLKIGKAAIVGWSDSGIIGLDLAMNHPERLTRLFAFGANYNVGGLRDDIDTNKTFNAYIDKAGQDYRRLSRTRTSSRLHRAVADVELPARLYASRLGRITVPTMIADGAHDEGIRPEHAEEIAG